MSDNMSSALYDDVITLGNSTVASCVTITNNTSPVSNGGIYITNTGTSTLSYPYATDTMSVDQTARTLKVQGSAEIDGKLIVGGKNIGEVLEKIEERLAILHPNTELEEKWENLRGLRKMYMELEAEIIEKEKIYNILKT